jgi:putative restriction endonuclease
MQRAYLGRYWWVNHRQPRHEIGGSYLWSPKRATNGSTNVSCDNMTRAVPGDVVFSHAEGRIGAVGLVVDRVRTAPTPVEFEATAPSWQSDAGWLLPVRFESLPRPLRLKEHMTQLAPVLPKKDSPIRTTGVGKKVYLAELPSPMAEVVRELLAGQLQAIEQEIAIETDDRLVDSATEEQIWQRANLSPCEKRQMINARMGQGIFRENVELFEKDCRVTGVLDRRHLRARHIKPWKFCNDHEKLDGFNGLLLSPHIDHLFDRGHISFADNGRVLISMHLNPFVIKAWGVNKTRAPRSFRPEQRVYLRFHREHVFEQLSGGRRS